MAESSMLYICFAIYYILSATIFFHILNIYEMSIQFQGDNALGWWLLKGLWRTGSNREFYMSVCQVTWLIVNFFICIIFSQSLLRSEPTFSVSMWMFGHMIHYKLHFHNHLSNLLHYDLECVKLSNSPLWLNVLLISVYCPCLMAKVTLIGT